MYLACVLATALTISPAARWSAQQETTSPSDSSAQTPTPTPPDNAQAPPPAEAQPTNQAEAPKPDAAKKGSTKARKRRAHKPPAVVAGEPPKKVVHQGGVTEPVAQIMPGISQEEADRQRQEAERLLAAADSDIKQLTMRNLNASQQDTVSQVRHYMEVARRALNDGDTQRAHTLALKAQLLSDDLLKH